MNIEELGIRNTLKIALSAREVWVQPDRIDELSSRRGGELSIEIAGPFPKGLQVSSKLVGAT